MDRRIPGPYRGYNKNKRRFVFIAVLFSLCLLAVSIFFLMQDYLVFSADGVRMEFPFFQSQKSGNNPGETSTVPPLKIESAQSEEAQTPSSSGTGTASKIPPSAVQVLHAVTADASRLSDSNYKKSLLSLPGLNAIVIDLKLPDGNVTYRSAAAAGDAQKNASDAVPKAIKEFSDNGVYVIGRMSAFRDNIAPKTTMYTSSVKTANGVLWLDYKYNAWLNPYETASAQYLCRLAQEAAGLGVNELMLYNFCFPVAGKTGLISYAGNGGRDRTAAINDALKAVSTAISGSNMALSVMPEDSALSSGKDADAGQDLAAFAKTGRIYFNASDNTFLDSSKWDQIINGAFNTGKAVPVLKTTADKSPFAALTKNAFDKCGFVLMSDSGNYTSANSAN